MKIIVNPRNVVIDVSDDAERTPHGIKMNGALYIETELTLVNYEGEQIPRPQRDLLIDGELIENLDWISPEEIEKRRKLND